MSDEASVVAAIDIGTHKVSVLIGRLNNSQRIEVIGMGMSANLGMSKGRIANFDKVVAAIKNAIQQAEISADCRIHGCTVAIPATDLENCYTFGQVNVSSQDKIITTNDIAKVLDEAKAARKYSNHYIAHALPLGFNIDENESLVQSPKGMTANKLTGHYQLLMLPISTMQNFENALNGAGIQSERRVVAPLASAEAGLLKDEKEYSVCLIDIGAGTTNVSLYAEGRLLISKTLNVGGENVTKDIATVLKTTTEEAERLKLAYGSLDIKNIKVDQTIEIHTINGTETILRLELIKIIQAQYDDILNKVYREINKDYTIKSLSHGIVLTGAACQIEGIVGFVRDKFSITVHLSNLSKNIYTQRDDFKEELKKMAYTTACGLLLLAQQDHKEIPENIETTKTWWAKFHDFLAYLKDKL